MTNYEKYFGTPEKLVEMLHPRTTHRCPLYLFLNSTRGETCRQCRYHIKECSISTSDEKRQRLALEWLQEECDERQ